MLMFETQFLGKNEKESGAVTVYQVYCADYKSACVPLRSPCACESCFEMSGVNPSRDLVAVKGVLGNRAECIIAHSTRQRRLSRWMRLVAVNPVCQTSVGRFLLYAREQTRIVPPERQVGPAHHCTAHESSLHDQIRPLCVIN